MLRYLAASIAVLLFTVECRSIHVKDEPPAWPTSYQVAGSLSLPYAELDEPFQAFYDSPTNRSRIDYYGDIVQTFQIASYPQYGATFKIAFMTNSTHYNYRRCFQANGTSDGPVEIQSVLPDLTGFVKAVGYAMINDQNVSMWYKVVQNGKKSSKYTMYINAAQEPVRYEMYGYDSLLGSHFDKYYVDYTYYQPGAVPDGVFDIPLKDTCDGFPGPGNKEARILANPIREYIQHDDSHHEELFSRFKKVHGKNYSNDKEHALRESVFRQNVRFIHSKNRAGLSYSLAINHMADRSSEELKLMNGRRPSKGYNGGKPFDKNLYNIELPDEIDWRLFGAVTQVKDQAVCGSCWSFGTTGTIEGALFLATGNLIRLSQQELMDCSWGEGNNACDGGEDFRAYQWIMENGGLASEDDYGSYKGEDFPCNSRNVSATVKLAGYTNVTAYDQEALRTAIVAHGPISVGIDASHLSLSFYANGVYYEPTCRNDPDGLDHAVLAVGYGVQNGQPYWLVKNSWSTYWGNDGYVLMSMKDNNCGVATSPTFVTVAK